MADYTVAADEQGVYEIALTANAPSTVTFAGTDASVKVEIDVHTAASPVYVRPGTTVTVKDPKARVVPSGTWRDFNVYDWADTEKVSLICAGAATVSVARA